MGTAAQPTRENRTITINFQNETTYFQLLGDGKAFVEFVVAFLLSLGFQLAHKASCGGGGCLPPPLPLYACPAGWSHHLACPVYAMQSGIHGPPALRLTLSPDAPGGRPRCLTGHAWRAQFGAVRCALPSLPMALYRLVCAFGHSSLVTVLTRCGLPLPVYVLADEKHSCLTDKVYLPTIVSGRVIWHLGYTEEASAAAFTQSYGEFQRARLSRSPRIGSEGPSPMAL